MIHVSVENHYSINKQRNAQVREDTPKARDEQLRELRQAMDEQTRQEALDEALAREIAARIECEEEQQRKMFELRDQAIAQQIQVNSFLCDKNVYM